jgi:ribosomal protein S14
VSVRLTRPVPPACSGRGTPPKEATRPIWKCADCGTNNDAREDAQCIVCDRPRPVSRVRINLPSPANSLRKETT